MADIGLVTNYGLVFARMSKVGGGGVASVNGTGIVVVTEVGWEILVNTTGGRDATIVGTSVIVVTGGNVNGGPDTFGAEGIASDN